MKIELFPNFSGIQKYIINGDRFDEVEFDSNYSAMVEFLANRFSVVPVDQDDLCQKIKEIILDEACFDEYLKYCDFSLFDAIIFLSQINSKKIFTSKIVQCLKDRHGKARRKQNRSRVRMERSKKDQRRTRKKTKS